MAKGLVLPQVLARGLGLVVALLLLDGACPWPDASRAARPLLVSSANVTDPTPTASPSSPSSPSNTSGGLFALRWPFFNGATGIKGSLAADPIPATASLPAWLMDAMLRGVRADQLTVAMGPFSPAP